MLRNPWIRHRPTLPQADFLTHPAAEVLYGGAAGGGKSDALLMAALQFVEIPGYAALLLRRSYADLALPGALMDRARSWLTGTAARWDGTLHRWQFPAGSTLQFGYLQHEADRYRYQSAEFQYVGFDELTQFPETCYTYLHSRLRRLAGWSVPLRMRSGSNPGGVGHDWVKRRFLLDAHERRAFVPARLDDNPHLDREAYVRSLEQLDPLTREQLLRGDWDAVAAGRFRREWFRAYRRRGPHFLIDDALVEDNRIWTFATVDPAASVKALGKPDPDWSVISTWGVTPKLELLWLDCRRLRVEVPDLVPAVEQAYQDWGCRYVAVEGGGTQKAVFQLCKRTRMAVREVLPGGQDKLVRATRAIVLAESGRVLVPESAPWLAESLAEVLRFTGDPRRDAHDDVVDTLSYAADQLAAKDGAKHQGFAPYVRKS